jgi:hypothetical protein
MKRHNGNGCPTCGKGPVTYLEEWKGKNDFSIYICRSCYFPCYTTGELVEFST